ncbi:hypothetical protein TCAL_00824 [Tigriopus californicus]|uniref:C2H2-type domain-containing protein n=1 Tax=Tigriopus californicus TaxID=6832 RepID=A0A553NFP7_TIGCA|nr:hypothetical protein TCAL_00824 [Tigriopus californicus]
MSHSLLATKAILEKELPEMVVQVVANAFNPLEEGLEVSPRLRGFPTRSNGLSCLNHPRLLLITQRSITFWEIWTATEGSSMWEWRQDLSCHRAQELGLLWQLLFPPKAECPSHSTATPTPTPAPANLAVSITDATREEVDKEDFGSEDDEEALPTHRGQLPADRSQCYLCGKMMKKKSLSLHVKLVHHGERLRRLECPHCQKVYKTQNALVKHSRIHSGERPYCCSICGKTYRVLKKDNDLWNNCQRRCSGNFRYRCGICDKQFNSKFRLNNHELVHSGEKPYRCPLCPYRCNRKDNLALHVKKKHDSDLKAAEVECGRKCDDGDT